MYFGGTLFEVYFFNMGLSLPEIYLADIFWFVAGLILLPLFKGFRTKPFMLAGCALALLSVLALLLYPEPGSAYIYRFILGTTHFFFWLPFNTIYYEYRKENNASLSAIYYSVSPVLALILPALAGIIAGNLGYAELYQLAIATYALAFILALFWLKDRKYEYDFRTSMESVSGLKSIIFLEGFSVMVIVSLTLPIMILLFIDEPIEVGWFLSLATVFSIAASFLVSDVSDKLHKRRVFLLLSALGFGLSVAATVFAPDLTFFFIAFGMVNFFARIFSPISFALAVDNSKSLADTMVAREFMLNLGRLAGGLAGFVIFMTFGIGAVLLFQGLAFLAYLPIFEIKKRKLMRK